jgi:O-phosphoseryl-tRNA synthetase
MNMIPDLTKGDPSTGDMTLRSFMPTTWLSTLGATYDEEKLPLRLFTIASAFRREPTPDSNHIETYNILSLAIGDKEMDLDRGLSILRKLFDNLGLKEIGYKSKRYPFPFFKKGSELELFGGDLELGTCGMVSDDVLSSRNLNVPVFIADIGVERTLMFRHGYPDIRELLYPQFYAAWKLSDEEIANSIKYVRRPQTDYGKEIAQAIHRTYKDNQEKELSRKIAWKGYQIVSDYGRFLISEERAKELNLSGKYVEIILKEVSEGMGLSGPAAFNEIWIDQGNIVAVPPNMAKKMEEKGAYRTNKSFVKAFSRFAAWKIERSLERGQTMKNIKKIKDIEGVNLKLTSKALYYMLSHKKKVDVQGPVYLKFTFKVKE